MMVCAIALMGYGTPSFAADGEVSVTTNKVWLSGATHIFARMAVSGISSNSISEQGICYSSSTSLPTIADKTCKVYLSNNGNIYSLSGLEPSTVYYIRAYVKEKGGDVMYGEPVKAITRPKGGVTYGIRDGFPDEALTRIQSAAKQAIDLWNEYTGIHGLYVNIGYGADTPTADCSYGGWMRVGPNDSYQRTGTLLHEMLHAIGVGTIGTWQNSFMRSNMTSGYWLGVRATRALRFWDNNPTEQLNGDGMHMWPYGVNGAHEDAGTQVLYIGNSVLAEALGEDGLAPTTGQFATPAYVFEQDDNQKYYLKNEEYGVASKFLRVDKEGNLQWTDMTAEEATTNDSVAWNITFDPVTCYYALKNVATGKYMSYSSATSNGIRTKDVSTLTEREYFHFLPSSVEVEKMGEEMKTGYWIANVQNNTANCLTAQASYVTKVNNLDFSKDAGSQRWLILTSNEVKELVGALRETAAKKFRPVVEKAEALLSVPHREVIEGTDVAFREVLMEMNEKLATASVDELAASETTLTKAVKSFLEGVQATTAEHPFDITFLVQHANLDALDGWTGTPTLNYSCGEFYQKTFDFKQKLSIMPKGVYELKVQGFQRPGTTTNVYTDYQAGTDKVDAFIYVGNTNNKQNICNIMADAQNKKIGVGSETLVGSKYIPNDMQSASKYFTAGLYENTVKATTIRKTTLFVGLKGTASASGYWTIFSNFRLYYYGLEDPATTAIHEVNMKNPMRCQGVYTLGGQKMRVSTNNLKSLPQGIYIVDGKKIVIK